MNVTNQIKRSVTAPLFWPVVLFKVQALRETEVVYESRKLDTPEAVYDRWRQAIETDPRHNADVESLYVFHLNTRRELTGLHLVAHGGLDSVFMHPREVFRTALVNNAAAIVLAHNHPSGNPTPSEADIKVTRDTRRAGDLLGVEVLDHVIIGRATPERARAWTSLRELGYFYAQ